MMLTVRLKELKIILKMMMEISMTYGDGLANVDLNNLVNFHNKHNKLVTLTGVSPKPRFGSIDFTEDMTIKYFKEKPYGNWIC